MSSSNIYNLISVVIVLVLVVIVIGVGILLLSPQPTTVDVNALPTLRPTLTSTATSTPTETGLPPTWTPTFTWTFTPSSTFTLTPTVTPSPSITPTPSFTFTPSITFTPSVSATFTPSPTPTGPTPTFTPSQNPFPYTLRNNEVTLTSNFANPTAGCNWQGIGGTILNAAGQDISQPNLRIRVFNNTADNLVNAGSNSLYGANAGWEVVVGNQPSPATYFVRLETINGTVISPRVDIVFPGTCEQNLAVIVFIATR